MSQHQLEISTPTDTEIVAIRRFNAPKALVYDCFTDPEKQLRWVGGSMIPLSASHQDTQVGGVWRWQMVLPSGDNFEFFGQLLEIVPGEKIVRTFVYNAPVVRENASVETASFTEEAGVTTLHIWIRHLTKENRDAHLSGMPQGAAASYDALEKLLESEA